MSDGAGEDSVLLGGGGGGDGCVESVPVEDIVPVGTVVVAGGTSNCAGPVVYDPGGAVRYVVRGDGGRGTDL